MDNNHETQDDSITVDVALIVAMIIAIVETVFVFSVVMDGIASVPFPV